MKAKRIIALVAVVGLAAAALAATFSASGPNCRPGPVYDLSGTWVATVGDPVAVAIIFNITPCDPARNKLTVVGDLLTDNSWLYEYFGVGPVAAVTKSYGTMVKTGRNTYQITMVCYYVDADFNFLCWDVPVGTIVQTGPDTFEYSGTSAFYMPDQDPFGDEPPAIGCWPETVVCRRVPILPLRQL